MRILGIGFKCLMLMTMVTGIIYPLSLIMAAYLIMPQRSGGSILYKEKKAVGSKFIGQGFHHPSYFWSRPSATDYHTLPSGGSNLSPTSQKLKTLFDERKESLEKSHGEGVKIPSDLLFASGSGLDPHISPKSAYYQIERIAKTRGIDKNYLKLLVDIHVEKKFLGIFGHRRINVLMLNLALDQRFNSTDQP